LTSALSTEKFLARLGSLDVKLWVDGERLGCRAPKGAITAEIAAQLKSRRDDIIAFLRRREASAQTRLAIRPAPRDQPPPLSFAQQRLWFLDKLEGPNPTYNIPFSLELTGRLDTAALRRSLTEIVRRHEALRTVFVERDGEPVQAIGPPAPFPLPEIDLRAMPAARREAELQCLAEAEALRPFALDRGPLVRAVLVHLEPDRWALLFTKHHIISDGWSVGIMVNELAALYRHYRERPEEPPPLPELPIQYADFAYWQRQREDVIAAQIAFWKTRLAGAPAVIDLPLDRPRPPVLTFEGSAVPFQIERDVLTAFRQLAQAAGASLFMCLEAAFAALLSRYSGQDDISIGTPTANRNHPGIEPLIGFFVNTLVLRHDLSGAPTARALIERTGRDAMDAFNNQDAPFERIVSELQPERDLSHTPLFQVMFILQNAPVGKLALPELTLRHLERPKTHVTHDLVLTLSETENGLDGALEYHDAVFDRATAARMAEHFGNLLRAMAARPEARIDALPLLGSRERTRILETWNDTALDYDRDTRVHRLFERQAARTPEAPAVAAGEARIAYGPLNARANRLARRLRALGVGPETLVGLCAAPSVDMAAGILAILKAGGAYVPMDPEYPESRLRYLIEDSGAALMLTSAAAAARLPDHDAPRLLLDDPDQAPADEDDANPPDPTAPENAAYVIYTSGSTGDPKGVVVQHDNLLHSLTARLAYYPAPPERFFLLSSFAFDSSVAGLFWTLCSGGELILESRETIADPERVAAVIDDRQATHLLTVPSLYDAVRRRPELLGSLKTVIVAGEACPPALTDEPLYNEYGPTEATVWCTVYRIEEKLARVPIGRPIANTRVYALDAALQPVPPLVAGELYVGGAGVSRGYLGRPALTAAKLVPDPFSPTPGARLYRTGDRVRWLADGNLAFLGRFDHQVKLRGFRIELGEIEALLSQHPDVAEAVAAVREDRPGRQILVGYVVPARPDAPESERLDARALRRWLLERLPEYMTPSLLVALDAMPLTPNGKVDRNALPAPGDAGGDRPYIAPRTQTEEALAAIWAQVLKLERLGIHDNFFEKGGHSLLATQALSRIRARFGVDLPLREVFNAPTVAEMGAIIAQLRSQDAGETPIARVPRDRPLPLSYAQQRLWFLDAFEQNSPFYNMPLAVNLTGPLEVSVLARSLRELTRRHESLRTTFANRDGAAFQIIAEEADDVFPVIDLSGLAASDREAERQRQVNREANRPFDLGQGPLMRATLLRLEPQRHALLHTMHHIVSDGWSMGVLIRETVVLYQAFARGLPSPLEPLPVQYADFAVWQREWLQSGMLEKQLAYWKETLGANPPALELPTDFPRPAVERFQGAILPGSLSPELSRRINGLARERQATLFMALLAGFNALMSRYSGQTDILVGSPVANRRRAEIESLIGFFANTLVMRADLAGDPDFNALIDRVKDTALGAFANQDVPFEMLVQALDVKRDMSRAPIFQVMFVLQNAPTDEIDVAVNGLKMQPVAPESQFAKFDLTLFMMEAEDRINYLLEYNTDLFSRATAERMADHFQRLLAHAVERPDTPITQLPLMGEEERRRLTVEWNRNARDYDDRLCFPQLIEAQAARTPEATAVVAEDARLDYAELNRRANGLAERLRALGVGPDTVVGVMLGRSANLATGFLGALKAGAAVVALDPTYPASRLAFIIEDARLPVILVDRDLGGLAAPEGTRLVAMEGFQQRSESNPEVALSPDNLLYVIYTSGSTGNPKGVGVTHRSILNLLAWQAAETTLNQPDRTLQFAAFGFCVSFQEMLSAWISGGALYIVSEEERKDPERLLAYLDEYGIQRLHLPFAALKQLAMTAQRTARLPSSLTNVITAGEQLQVTDAVRDMFARIPGCRLHNQYGASETHVITALTLSGDPADWPFLPTAGRPVSNVPIYLLDEHLAPVPIGVPGMIYAGGPAVARAYLNRTELNLDKFIPDPFSATPGERLYKTGDLARYRADGEIQYLGRADQMLKIQGFRVEPGEVEAALRQHPGVHDTAVVPFRAQQGDWRLAAYIVPAPGVGLEGLDELLKQALPSYSIPSAFMELDALPVTAHGKLDREALPEPAITRRDAAYVPPQTPSEQVLAAVWSAVLELDRVGRHDDFFELGGHSLLATQVASRIRDAFSRDMPLKAFFGNPTLQAQARWIDEAARADAGLAEPPLEPAPRDGLLPLSYNQDRLWFLDRLNPGSFAYSMPFAFRLRGALNGDAFKRALDALVARHEALRTRFVTKDGCGYQAVDPPTAAAYERLDLRGLPEAEREQAALDKIRGETARPFDLERGPLFRALLCRVADEVHLGLINMHHIVSDGWTIRILLGELSALYEAFDQGAPDPLPPLRLHYADFAVWQRAWLSGETMDRKMAFWEDQLADAPAAISLPTDHPYPQVQTFAGATHEFEIGAELSAAVRRRCRETGTTPFMLFIAVYATLLSRYSGQRDVCIGSPVAGRNRSALESMAGFFVNSVVFRLQLAADADFNALLDHARRVALDAFAHQDVPFEQIVDRLQPARDMSRASIFQVMFSYESVDIYKDVKSMPGLVMETPPNEYPVAKFELSLNMSAAGDRFGCGLEYNTDLFKPETIERMAGHFLNLTAALTAAPEAKPAETGFLGAAERETLLARWSEEAAPYPQDRVYHRLFEARARAAPDRDALICGERRLSYGELNVRANKLARCLRGLGVRRDAPVGICADRTIEMAVGMLAAMKAGGAYLPLNPNYPESMLRYMIEDSGLRILLLEEHLLDFPLEAETVLCLERDEARLTDGLDGGDLDCPADPLQLAYVIYTSGSTGAPKGVGTAHAAMVNHNQGILNGFELGPEDRVLQFCAISFDQSVEEIFPALLSGGALVLHPHRHGLSAAEMLALLERQQVTVAHLPTAYWHELAETLHRQGLRVPKSFRLLNVGGEKANPGAYEAWRQAADPDSTWVNTYGPTEAAVTSHWHFIRPGDDNPLNALLPIGRPLPGYRSYIVDERLNLTPIGVVGELTLGGPVLARGYLNRPDKTATNFAPNPFATADEPGARLYRTGDLARYLPDGSIQVLGRTDFQVKIRGFRVEIGEIEAALSRHPELGEAVVLVVDGAGGKQLAAYVAPHGAPPDPAELQEYLRARLPAHMIPAAFVFLDALPLTKNGKVDRQALPEPEAALVSDRPYAAPETPTEQTIARIWGELLELPRVGVNDHFFELGGHSLLAARVASRLAESLDVDLPIRALFEHAELADLALYIDLATGQAHEENLDDFEEEGIL